MTSPGKLDNGRISIWIPVAAYALLAIAAGGTGIFAFERYKTGEKEQRQQTLLAITDLKARLIDLWMSEHRNDAESIVDDHLLGRELRLWQQSGMPNDSRRKDILIRLTTARAAHDFAAISILDADGAVALTAGEKVPPLTSLSRDLAKEAIRSGEVRWVAIRHAKPAGEQDTALAIIAPLKFAGPKNAHRAGAVLFRIDSDRFLIPLIQSWPIPSASAESFLFRREGNEIVYLNELRHRNDGVLSLRFNIDEPKLLAAAILRGNEGVLEGEDYRRVPVVGAGRRIANSPLYLISKIDTSEIYAPIEAQKRVILTATLGFVALSGLVMLLWWRQYLAKLALRRIQDLIAQQALAKHYDYLTRYANDVILLLDEDGRILDVNNRGLTAYGYSREEFLGMNARDLRPDEARTSFDEDWRRRNPDGIVYETLHRRRDGSTIPVEIIGGSFEVEGGRFRHSVIRDITERKEAEKHMRLYQSVFETTGEAVLITDASQRIVSVNRAFTEITGYATDESVGRTPTILQSGRQDKAFYTQMWDSLQKTGRWQGEVWNRRKSGEIYPEWEHISAVHDDEGRVTHYVAIFSDISERKSTEERITHMAQHDALTGLPNRLLMQDRLGQSISAAKRNGGRVAVMMIDLDRFKNVNDSLGHQVGDQLLQGVAERLRNSVRQSDTVSRLGGDEFVVILPAIEQAEGAAHAGRNILQSLAAPFSLCGHEIRVTPSIGISIYPDDGDGIDSLIRNADTAMYQAKENGRNNCQFFTRAMNVRAVERLTLEADLRLALERNEFVLHYQPQIDLQTRRVVGVEALIRWNSPKRGFVSPANFIVVAEECRLIIPLGEWILLQACQQRRLWDERGMRNFPVSVNVSALQFRERDFDRMVARVVREVGLDPALLDLEMTESIIMGQVEETVAMLDRLKDLGVSLSIDDFGTGYSSLAYLKRFPVNRLKVDQSFVRDITSDPNDREIIKAIVALGHALDLRVIAEGVENDQQLTLLVALGCDECQGYLFSKPLPAEDVPGFLHRQGLPFGEQT